MHKRFLDGEDYKWIDYDQIDNDIALDDRRQMEQDEEDKYFDAEDEGEEEAGKTEGKESVYTGVLDYWMT